MLPFSRLVAFGDPGLVPFLRKPSMKRSAILAVLAVAGGAFAFDQYLPVGKGKLESDLMVQRTAQSGGYDADGKSQSLTSEEGSPATTTPSLQFKYGIIDGLDVELLAAYELRNKDNGDVSGLSRPELALKYVHPEMGVGGFLNVALPMGSEKIVGEKPATTFFVGAIYGKTFGQIVVNAFADYQFNTESEKMKQDAIQVYAQGQYNVNTQIGPYLGVDYAKAFEMQMDGTSVPKSDGYLLTLKPGLNFAVNEMIAIEANVPVTVMGKSKESSWALYAGVYYTIGL